MKNEETIKKELTTLLKKGNSHVSLDDALLGIPHEKVAIRPDGLPYSLWELTEHIRISQWDIVQFCKDPKHESPKWPEGYWPKEKHPSEEEWKKCLDKITSDRNEMIDMLNNSGERLFDPIPHGDGQSLFKEALVLADHTSYHTAEIIVVRRLLHIWKS